MLDRLMNQVNKLLICIFLLIPSQSVFAQITLYNSEVSFKSNYPGLQIEDFEFLQVAANSAVDCGNALNSSSDDDCVDPMDVIDGVTITTSSGDLVALGVGFLGAVPSKSIAPNIAIASLILEFDTPVRAISMTQSTFSVLSDTPNLELFDDLGNSIFEQDTFSDVDGEFLGIVTETTPIKKIVIKSTENRPELIDNLSFKVFSEADVNLFMGSNQAAFEMRNSELVIEDFESGMVSDNSAKSCSAVIDSITTDDCFVAGSILSGIKIETLQGGDLALLGVNTSNINAKSLAPDISIHSLKISFDKPTHAFSFMQHSTAADEPILKLFDEQDNELFSSVIAVDQIAKFIGVESRIPIAYVTIFSPNHRPEWLDAISFPEVIDEPTCFPIRSQNNNVAVICL